MKRRGILPLDDADPRVSAAREAEKRLFARYGLSCETRFVMSGGVSIRLLEFGAGEPVLMVPGNTGDGFVFAPLLPHLKGRRVIVLNRPGGGLSGGFDHRRVNMRAFAVETLANVLDALGLEKAPLIAHSMGGHWSLWFSADKPERVAALGLLGVPGNVLDTRPPFALRLAAVPGLNRLILRAITPRSRNRALGSLAFMGHAQKTVNALPEEMAECYFRFQNLPNYALSSLSLMESMNRFPGNYRISAEELTKITPPAALFWGENDPFGKITTGRNIAETLPDAVFRLLPGGGHLPWLDAPRLCAEFLLDGILAKSGG